MTTDYLQIPEEQLVEKAPSAINDTGLFARQFIPWGKIFLEYKGRIVSGKELREAEEKAGRTGKSYLFELSADRYIDADQEGNLAGFANHSCDPTCHFIREDDKIYFVARQDLWADDEITIDYEFWNKNVPCHCGASRCRKFI
jgi:SET domain-containing protein